MSQYDVNSLYEFLQQTPEKGLRQMLVDGKPVTEIHFNLLIKIVRACKVEDFKNHFEKGDFPKIKMNPNEQNIKEKFWKDCVAGFNSRGLLTPSVASKAA